jgi:hypothetical protein
VSSEVISREERAKSLFGRRDFFVAVIAAGAAVVAPRAISAALADAEDGDRATRYKETEHIKTFYKVNRL